MWFELSFSTIWIHECQLHLFFLLDRITRPSHSQRVLSSSFSWSSPWLWLNYLFNGVSKIKVQGFSDLYFVDKENIFHHGILNIAFNTTDIIYDYINQIFINE